MNLNLKDFIAFVFGDRYHVLSKAELFLTPLTEQDINDAEIHALNNNCSILSIEGDDNRNGDDDLTLEILGFEYTGDAACGRKVWSKKIQL